MAGAILVHPDRFLFATEFFQQFGQLDYRVGMVGFEVQRCS